uniref:Uncharacterized protein n=1 Tax=Glossina pallidipes TaxID=7398 RepID=A0A1A9ZL76_GLOPL
MERILDTQQLNGTGAEVIDLTPLISTNKNYQAEIDAATIGEHRLPNSIKPKTSKSIINIDSRTKSSRSSIKGNTRRLQFSGVCAFTLPPRFFLNVCRPLVPKYGLGCPGGSAACMAKMDKVTGKPEEEQLPMLCNAVRVYLYSVLQQTSKRISIFNLLLLLQPLFLVKGGYLGKNRKVSLSFASGQGSLVVVGISLLDWVD